MKLPTLPLLTRMRLRLPAGRLWPHIEGPFMAAIFVLVVVYLPTLLDAPCP